MCYVARSVSPVSLVSQVPTAVGSLDGDGYWARPTVDLMRQIIKLLLI